MRILVIDNNIDQDCWGSPDLRRSLAQASGTLISVRRAPHEDLPKSHAAYDRLVVSGSKTSCLADAPWIESLHGYIRSWLDSGKPYLGVCYGHQSLVRVLSGKPAVRKGKQAELGWTKIERAGESRLLHGLPSTFYTYSSHLEEVSEAPRNYRVTSRSAACEIQSIELDDRPVFGIQFHPERNLSDAEASLRVVMREEPQRPVLEPKRGKELYNPEVAQKIFGNFLAL